MIMARQNRLIYKIVSGGQTGVDRAALDAALSLAIPCGGWCPAGRRAEDGRIDDRYPLTETPSDQYAERTQRNVRDSDGTLIIANGPLTGGTRRTRLLAEQDHKPCWIINISDGIDSGAFRQWLETNNIRILNVAGPRESTQAGIYERARQVLVELLA